MKNIAKPIRKVRRVTPEAKNTKQIKASAIRDVDDFIFGNSPTVPSER